MAYDYTVASGIDSNADVARRKLASEVKALATQGYVTVGGVCCQIVVMGSNSAMFMWQAMERGRTDRDG